MNARNTITTTGDNNFQKYYYVNKDKKRFLGEDSKPLQGLRDLPFGRGAIRYKRATHVFEHNAHIPFSARSMSNVILFCTAMRDVGASCSETPARVTVANLSTL